MGSIINDVQVGQQTRINIRSQHYGRKRVPLAQTLTFSTKETNGVVPEFDNDYPVLAWQVFDNSDVKFECLMADQYDVDAMIHDMDPTQKYLGFDAAEKRPVDIWVNYMGKNLNYLYQAEYAELMISTNTESMVDLKNPAKRPYSFMGGRHLRIAAKTGSAPIGIQYNRFVNTPAFATADDIALTGGGGTSGTFPNAPQTFPIKGGAVMTTQNFISVRKNNVQLEYTTDFTISGTTLTLVANTVAGDVVEAWTVAAANVV